MANQSVFGRTCRKHSDTYDFPVIRVPEFWLRELLAKIKQLVDAKGDFVTGFQKLSLAMQNNEDGSGFYMPLKELSEFAHALEVLRIRIAALEEDHGSVYIRESLVSGKLSQNISEVPFTFVYEEGLYALTTRLVVGLCYLDAVVNSKMTKPSNGTDFELIQISTDDFKLVLQAYNMLCTIMTSVASLSGSYREFVNNYDAKGVIPE